MNELLEHAGFTADPFDSTNADNEPNLTSYFVPPPYFASVLGDPANPRSHIVFAPRGGGKTAQRRMIEKNSEQSGKFLCITYDDFDQPVGFRARDASWAYHMNQICRLVVQSIVQLLEADELISIELTRPRQKLLRAQIDHFLGGLSAQQFRTAVNSLKTFPERTAEFLRRYSGPIGVALEAVKKKWGMDFEIPKSTEPISIQDASLKFHFHELIATVRELGYESCYILIDKVDELAITGTSRQTFDLILPLMSDLPTLETQGAAFKFFLWDQLEGFYDASGYARRDRVPVYTLSWTVRELEGMLAARMKVYSSGATSSFNELLDYPSINAHRLLALMASGSPRDMIRIAKRITSETLRMTSSVQSVSEADVWAGVKLFSDERAKELFGGYVADLQKVARPTFTTNYIGSTVFRVSENAARRKIQLWTESGMIAKIGEIPNPPNRPSTCTE